MLIENNKTGIYNATNPEPLTHIQILEEYKKYNKDHKFILNDKIIYIEHFRTPKLWNIYTKILDENNLFDKFTSINFRLCFQEWLVCLSRPNPRSPFPAAKSA